MVFKLSIFFFLYCSFGCLCGMDDGRWAHSPTHSPQAKRRLTPRYPQHYGSALHSSGARVLPSRPSSKTSQKLGMILAVATVVEEIHQIRDELTENKVPFPEGLSQEELNSRVDTYRSELRLSELQDLNVALSNYFAREQPKRQQLDHSQQEVGCHCLIL